jgi:hypothetical protein
MLPVIAAAVILYSHLPIAGADTGCSCGTEQQKGCRQYVPLLTTGEPVYAFIKKAHMLYFVYLFINL